MYFGILSLLTSILFVACEKPEPPIPEPIPDGLEWLECNVVDTTGTKALNFDWQKGDQIKVYSFVGNRITYADVTTITNAAGNTCKMKVLVDKNATGYLAVYPADGCVWPPYGTATFGAPLSVGDYNINWNGHYNFHDISIMTCWAPKRARDFYFHQSLSLLKVTNTNELGKVRGTLIKTMHSEKDNQSRGVTLSLYNHAHLYIPISTEKGYVDIQYAASNGIVMTAPSIEVYPGLCINMPFAY